MGRIGIATGTGIKQQAISKYHAEIPAFNGRHLWVFAGVWMVANPARQQQVFDMENLLTVEGPGCFWCDALWTPTIGAHCPGPAEDDNAS